MDGDNSNYDIYGAEIWILSQKDLENLEAFQKYAGRRFQCFTMNSPNASSYYGLGWIGLNTFICINKLIFTFTMITMDGSNYIRKLFRQRAIDFNDNIQEWMVNRFRSPTFEILKISINFGLYDALMRQLFYQRSFTKNEWKALLLKTAWEVEDNFWKMMYPMQNKCLFIPNG